MGSKNTRWINSHTEVYDASVVDLDVSTRDVNSEGVLVGHNDRRMHCGVVTDGSLAIWVATNGDPITLSDSAVFDNIGAVIDMADDSPASAPDDIDAIYAALANGDVPDSQWLRDALATGIARWREGIEAAGRIFRSEAATDALNWHTAQIDDVADHCSVS